MKATFDHETKHSEPSKKRYQKNTKLQKFRLAPL